MICTSVCWKRRIHHEGYRYIQRLLIVYTDIFSGYGDLSQGAVFDTITPTTKEVLNRAITGQQGITGQTQQQPTGEPGAVVGGQPGQAPGDGGGNQTPTTAATNQEVDNEAQQASGKADEAATAEANGALAFILNGSKGIAGIKSRFTSSEGAAGGGRD